MGSTSAVHYETVCMYKVVMRFLDIDNPSEHSAASAIFHSPFPNTVEDHSLSSDTSL